MAENNRKWFISGKPNENDYMDWWNAYNSMGDSTSLEDTNAMANEWNEGSWNNGKDAANTYRNNGISFSQFAESPAGKFLLSRPRARDGIKESYGLSDKVGELLDKGDINTAMELAKQEEQNNNTEVLKEEERVPEAEAKVEGNTEAVSEAEAESNTDNKKAAKEKKNYIAELGKVIAKGAELGKAKGAELGKAIAKGAKKITDSDIYNDYVYGNVFGSTKRGGIAKEVKEANAANFLANEYPSLLTSVFSRKSGKNMGERLAGLGELLATIGSAAANGALAGFHGQTAPAPVVGRQAQMYNNAYMKQNEREQNRFDAVNRAEVEYADKASRVNRTKYLKDAPQEIKDFAITSLGSAPLDYEGFKTANKKTFELFVNRQIAKYNTVRSDRPYQELDKDEQKRLMDHFENLADKEMLPYYNEYRFVHDQYDEGLKKQGLVLSNTGTGLSNTGTELSNVYKSLENQSKAISNEQQKQTFINNIRDQINNLRKLKYETIKSQSLDYFAVEKALMDVVTGIYTTSTDSSFSGNAGINIKAINAGVSKNKSAGSQIDSLAKKNIPLAKEAADAFKKLTDGNINEWNKWIDAQIKELEKTLNDVKKARPEDYQSRLGYDGNSRINKDFNHYRQILMG